MIYAAVWFAFISLVTAVVTAADKRFAIKGKRRTRSIREKQVVAE